MKGKLINSKYILNKIIKIYINVQVLELVQLHIYRRKYTQLTT